MIVESAVHFMAEAIAILAHDDQQVWITNPKAGCTMEMLAKDYMVAAGRRAARSSATATSSCVVAYMNTGGRLKALAGRTGGAVCTSSNAHRVVALGARAEARRSSSCPTSTSGATRRRSSAWTSRASWRCPIRRRWRGALKVDDTTVAGRARGARPRAR